MTTDPLLEQEAAFLEYDGPGCSDPAEAERKFTEDLLTLLDYAHG